MDSDQRAMRQMRFPERGILRVTGVHEGHSHCRISGVITAPGIAPTRVEHKTDQRGRWAMGQELPVMVDSADPSRFAILWDEAGTATGAGSAPPFQYGPGPGISATVVSIGPDGQPYPAQRPEDLAAQVEAAVEQAFTQRGRQMPPRMAARMEQALNRALGQAGPQGQAIGETIRQALSHAPGQPYGPAGGQPYGPAGGQQYGPEVGQSYAPTPGQPYGPAGGQPYGPAPGQPYGPAGGQQYGPEVGQPYATAPGQPYGPAGGQQYGSAAGQSYGPPVGPAVGPPFGQGGPGGPEATGFAQVSWNDQDLPGAGPQAGFSPAQRFPASSGGELASAIVLAAQDVAPMPGFAAPGGALDVTLEVRRADGSSYTTRTQVSVTAPERRAALAPGTRLSVRIDPDDPARVEIDSYGQF